MEKTTLLASFIEKDELQNTLKEIKNNFTIATSKIFILKNKLEPTKLILTYNVVSNDGGHSYNEVISNTISLHRKKETNTLYTLNALNEVVKSENNGILDKSFKINWDAYANCILIIQKNKGLLKIETELEKVLDISKIN
jgi:hypothetical protein